MTLAANQPYFLPYFPYWQLIHAADRFLVADDYAFIRHGWITREKLQEVAFPMRKNQYGQYLLNLV